MIIELALERAEFTCGRCWNQWSIDYDVQHYRDGEGRDWEYFSRDGIAVASPYTPAGALACPRCDRRWVGRILARRLIPAPPGPAGTPREKIMSAAGHRPERHGAPLLGAAAHTQPEQLGPPDESPVVPGWQKAVWQKAIPEEAVPEQAESLASEGAGRWRG